MGEDAQESVAAVNEAKEVKSKAAFGAAKKPKKSSSEGKKRSKKLNKRNTTLLSFG